MKTSWMKPVSLAVFLCLGGLMLLQYKSHTERQGIELDLAASRYDSITAAMHSGDFEYASTQVDALIADAEARTDIPVWDTVHTAALELKCMLPYAKAEQLSEKYRRVYQGRSSETLPDTKDMFNAYGEFVKNCSALIGEDGFTDPEVAWRLEYNVATGLVWQLILKQAGSPEVKFEDLKPFYDQALAHYKKSMAYIENVAAPDSEVRDSVRYVSQTLDFMTRAPQLLDKQEKKEEQQQQQQKQKSRGQGLGDLLEKAKPGEQKKGQGLGSILSRPKEKADEQNLFPSPLGSLGAGQNRFPGGGVK